MRLRVGARTDIGRVRQENEDSYIVGESLYAVADGLGGHAGGEVASALALETLGKMVFRRDGQPPSLAEGFKRANRAILERARRHRKLRGMGTTLTAVLVEGETAHVTHVGDSRLYLLREGDLKQLTEDDTLVQRMIEESGLSPENRDLFPAPNVLTRALGADKELTVQQFALGLRAGDRLLLCTDGLTSVVENEPIRRILVQQDDPQGACDRLVEAANRTSGVDNITVVVVDVSEPGAGGDVG